MHLGSKVRIVARRDRLWRRRIRPHSRRNAAPLKQILQRIAKTWLVDSVRWKTPNEQEASGFDWWPGDFCTSVRAYLPTASEPDSQIKILIRTDFMKDVPIDSKHFEPLAALSSVHSTSTYGWIYSPKTLLKRLDIPLSREWARLWWFSSTAYIAPDNIDWMPDLLATTALIQVINAEIQARGMAEILGGTPNITRPADLRDAEMDGILSIIEDVYAPLGKDPSRWAGTGEFEQFAETWARSDVCFGTADSREMTLETPFGSDSALIRFHTANKHHQLGHELTAILRLPIAGNQLEIATTVAMLNRRYFGIQPV